MAPCDGRPCPAIARAICSGGSTIQALCSSRSAAMVTDGPPPARPPSSPACSPPPRTGAAWRKSRIRPEKASVLKPCAGSSTSGLICSPRTGCTLNSPRHGASPVGPADRGAWSVAWDSIRAASALSGWRDGHRCQGLWLCGDSLHPGEGTAGVSLSALNACRQLLAERGARAAAQLTVRRGIRRNGRRAWVRVSSLCSCSQLVRSTASSSCSRLQR